jgi:hypothetical protein
MTDERPESRRDLQILAHFRRGGMAEWSMAVVLKTGSADLSNSRIPS